MRSTTVTSPWLLMQRSPSDSALSRIEHGPRWRFFEVFTSASSFLTVIALLLAPNVSAQSAKEYIRLGGRVIAIEHGALVTVSPPSAYLQGNLSSLRQS